MDEHRLKVFENMVLRRIFRPKGNEVMGKLKVPQLGDFIICTHHHILLGR
jgi:hypothetical protein